MCARASTLGLLPEQIDPSSGAFFGNFPQAFSHIGVIAAGVTLARHQTRTTGRWYRFATWNVRAPDGVAKTARLCA